MGLTLLAASIGLHVSDSIAMWVEGIALLLIFGLELKEYKRQGRDRKEQHEESAAQLKIMQTQADALVNSERAWVVAELIPQAMRFMDNRWYRFVGDKPVAMSEAELHAGHHLKYKLKLTNMGRTPAQIFGFTIRYSCLGKDVKDLPENDGGTQSSHRPFEHLLGGNGQAIEIGEPVVDVGLYMRDNIDAINKLDRTAVIHGSIKYRHMFSKTDYCYADFCYVYTVSEERLSSVGRHTKQRQQSAD